MNMLHSVPFFVLEKEDGSISNENWFKVCNISRL